MVEVQIDKVSIGIAALYSGSQETYHISSDGRYVNVVRIPWIGVYRVVRIDSHMLAYTTEGWVGS